MATTNNQPAAANAANNNNINYPVLKLIPLTQSECASALYNDDNASTTPAANENEWQIPPGVQKKRRPTLCLKLCSERDDILDVDDESSVHAPEPTRYARLDNKGNYSCELLLGRTEFTCMSWGRISRALCDVGMTRKANNNNDGGDSSSSSNDVTAWIKMRKDAYDHVVHLDGDIIVNPVGQRIHVNDGSILAMFGPTGFAYRVKIESNGAVINRGVSAASRKRRATSTAAAAATSTTAQSNESDTKRHKHPGVQQSAHSMIENSTECPLCYEVLVKTVAVHPCGHMFCQECVDKHLEEFDDEDAPKDCPCCRGRIEGFTRCRIVDTMIWAVALSGCLDRDDAANYLKRRESANMDAPTEEEKESILRCGGGEQAAVGNGSQRTVFMEPKPMSSSTVTYIPTLHTMTTSQVRASLNNNSSEEVVDLT